MLRPRRAQPPLSLPQADSNSDLHPPLPSNADLRPPLPLQRSSTSDSPRHWRRWPRWWGLWQRGWRPSSSQPQWWQGWRQRQRRHHRLPARAGAAPPGRPSTTPRLAPSTCGQARPGHRSRADRCMPSSLHRRWGHRSRLL
jgi:hypothetical protein